MRFIANGINGEYLTNILKDVTYNKDNIEYVYAAIAYGNKGNNNQHCLISNCLENNFRLDIWMRYDETVPVSIPMLEYLLKNHKNNIFCKFIPDYLHSKVIWWKGFGVYIGSHNLSERAWISNIEAGIFLDENELFDNHMDNELENFFNSLKENKDIISLTQEYIEDMKIFSDKKRIHDIKQKSTRKYPEKQGLTFISKQKSDKQNRESFRKDWGKALTAIRSIAKQLEDHRPIWIRDDIPDEWHADQFLHGFYYNQVRQDDRKIPYEEFYEKNKNNPQKAVKDAMMWWQKTLKAPTNEDITLNKYAPTIKSLLSKEKIHSLNKTDIEELIEYTHATKDHIKKLPKKFFKLNDHSEISIETRIPIFVSWLLEQKNEKNQNLLDILYFLLWSDEDDLCERLYRVARTEEYKIPNYSLSSFSEIIGWARPELSPPRNGRTSKALRALGYDVKEY